MALAFGEFRTQNQGPVVQPLTDNFRSEPVGGGLQLFGIIDGQKGVVIFTEADLFALKFLLDEVMAGLNPAEIDEIIPVIRGIRDSGVTILLIEHVMRAVMNLSDHAWVLNNGSLIASGTPVQIASDPQVIEAYLGHGAAARMAAQQQEVRRA